MRYLLVAVVLFLCSFAIGFWAVQGSDTEWREDDLFRTSTPQFTPSKVEPPDPSDTSIRFQDIAEPAGISFRYYDSAVGHFHIRETLGGGMSLFDFDGDGHLDIYLVNGRSMPLTITDSTHHSSLFRQTPSGTFQEVSDASGVALTAYAHGASAGDFDNDGFDDMLVTTWHGIVLYHNNGDGTFHDWTSTTGLSSDLWGTTAAWADLDLDGDLDAYVATYLECPEDDRTDCEVHCSPLVYEAHRDLLFNNQGRGNFNECGESSGIRDRNGRGLGVAIADLNQDNVPDIFVANDASESFLFLNKTAMVFEESAVDLGVALNSQGRTISGMGVACSDYNRNGLTDLFVSNFHGASNVLFENVGSGFLDNANVTGLGLSSISYLGFGTVFIDADLDSRPDLFVANGHVSDLSSKGVPYRMRPQLYRNNGATFSDISSGCGPFFSKRRLGRGVARGDINNDGLPDIVVGHINDPAAVLINRTAEHGHWVGLKLVGRYSNRNGMNASIELSLHDQISHHQIVAGCGYLSSSDSRIVLGLGNDPGKVAITIRWPLGKTEELEMSEFDRYYTVRE